MSKEDKRVEEHADKFRQNVVKLIEDAASTMVTLGICETMSIARHEAAAGLGMIGFQYAQQMRTTMSAQEVLTVLKQQQELEKEKRRQERIRSDPNIN